MNGFCVCFHLYTDSGDFSLMNAQGGYYENALQAASYGGLDEIAKLLINKGVDVKIQGEHYGNAPQAAFYPGHEAMAKLLI